MTFFLVVALGTVSLLTGWQAFRTQGRNRERWLIISGLAACGMWADIFLLLLERNL